MRARGKYWVGVDLGGTKTLACVFDAGFQVCATEKKKTRDGAGAADCARHTAAVIEAALDSAGVRRGRVAGIGVGVAGMLDLDRGVLLHAPNLGWKNVALAAALTRKFKARAVLANDVDAGTYAEYRFGAARGARCVVGVFPGTGIGGGCVYEGRILRGRIGSCMEIGHMLVDPQGRLCGCGRRGCLETVASRLAIASEAAAAAFRGDAPILLKLAGTGVADIRSRVLSEAIRAGDRTVDQIVRHAAQHLGQALASVIHLLAPDTILLGGGLVEEMPALYLREVKDAARTHAIRSFVQGVRFVTAELGGQAVALGAAALAADPAKKPGKTRGRPS